MHVDLNWLIARHRVRGERLPPRPKETTAETDWGKELKRRVGDTVVLGRRGFGKDFENSDYQYFALHHPNAEYTTCRACDVAVRNVKSTRKEHLKKGCSMFVRELMEKCKREKLCVVCGAPAVFTCWGFWFDSRACTTQWEKSLKLAMWVMVEKLTLIRNGKWRPKT